MQPAERSTSSLRRLRRWLWMAGGVSALVAAGILVLSPGSPPKQTELDLAYRQEPGDPDAMTLGSIRKVGGFYTLVYHGDYEERLRWMHEWMLKQPPGPATAAACSLFTTTTRQGEVLYGRNFDWKECGVVLGRYAPPGKYQSFAMSRLDELHVKRLGDGAGTLSQAEKDAALFLPYFPADGINEKGLTIGIAGAPERRVKRTEARSPMFVLLFIRRALDNCQNVEEVARYAETVSLYDNPTKDMIRHHFLVADAAGNWLVIDYPDGEPRCTRGRGQPQVRTNHFLDGGPSNKTTQTSFSRFRKLHDALAGAGAPQSAGECLSLLAEARGDTRWSIVYDACSGEGLLCVNEDYHRRFHFGFRQTPAADSRPSGS